MSRFIVLFVALLFFVGCDGSEIFAPKPDYDQAKAVVGLSTWLAVRTDGVDDVPAPSPSGVCPDCNGDGFIGDGTIRIRCDTCDGTGKVTSASEASSCGCKTGSVCACGPGGEPCGGECGCEGCTCEPLSVTEVPEATEVSRRQICYSDGSCVVEVTYSDGSVKQETTTRSSSSSGWGTSSTSGQAYRRTRIFPRLFR